MKNELKSEANVSKDELETTKVICFFIDIRNSTELNDGASKNKLLTIYSEFLNSSYEIFSKNGFKNIDIQGDGIFGLYPFDKDNVNDIPRLAAVKKCLKELNNLIVKIDAEHKIRSTISIRYGEELYSAFGFKKNGSKQLVYFGNVVSYTKKMNGISFKNSKIIISIDTIGKENLNKIDLQDWGKSKEIYLKLGAKFGKVKLYSW